MQKIAGLVKKRAAELLSDGTVVKVLGYKCGDFVYDVTPAYFDRAEDIGELEYSSFCSPNLSKYLIKACGQLEQGQKIAVLLKPCDTFSFNQLLTEHRIDRDKLYVLAVGCKGMADVEKLRAMGLKGITKVIDRGEQLEVVTIYGSKTVKKSDALLEKCESCKSRDFKVYDEIIDPEPDEGFTPSDRFELVSRLESMTAQQRYDYWNSELSKCIRCNACRNVCPACSCVKCVFDNIDSGAAGKVNSNSFEEKMFHIIRAYHVAGRCTDCGECSRVCPQGIPLHLLNRKFIKDINELYGEYQAGEQAGSRAPLVDFNAQDDAEPSVIHERGMA